MSLSEFRLWLWLILVGLVWFGAYLGFIWVSMNLVFSEGLTGSYSLIQLVKEFGFRGEALQITENVFKTF